MEFRRSRPERRQDRRICPKCKAPSGTKRKCPQCGGKTEARIQIVWFIDGKRCRELTYCWRDQDAQEILQRKEADYWRQQDLGVEREIGGTLREAVDAFSATVAERSADYKKQVNTALTALARGVGWDRPVPLISTQEITSYKEDGLSTLSSTTVRSYMLVLRRLFAYLHQEGWIRRNPALKVKLPPATRRRDHLRPEEVGHVLQVFWETEPAIAPIATALTLGGWRKGEIINLRWPDLKLRDRWAYVLDFEGDELTARWSPKTESSRRAVPLHPMVALGLEQVERVRRPDGQLSPWVFPVIDRRKRRRYADKHGRSQPVFGDRRSPGTSFFGDKLRKVLVDAGVEREVTIHGLRRTFAVLLQEAGAPDAIIRQALGHGSRGVTETHYLPRRDDAIKRWVDAIEVEIPALKKPEPPAELAPAATAEGTGSAPELPRAAADCHQSATNPVANRPPQLRVIAGGKGKAQ